MKKITTILVIAGMLMFTGCNGDNSSALTENKDSSSTLAMIEDSSSVPAINKDDSSVLAINEDSYSVLDINEDDSPVLAVNEDSSPVLAIDEDSYSVSAKYYVANKNSGKLHSIYCDSLPYEKNRIYFSSIEEANDAGYIDNHKECMGD